MHKNLLTVAAWAVIGIIIAVWGTFAPSSAVPPSRLLADAGSWDEWNLDDGVGTTPIDYSDSLYTEDLSPYFKSSGENWTIYEYGSLPSTSYEENTINYNDAPYTEDLSPYFNAVAEDNPVIYKPPFTPRQDILLDWPEQSVVPENNGLGIPTLVGLSGKSNERTKLCPLCLRLNEDTTAQVKGRGVTLTNYVNKDTSIGADLTGKNVFLWLKTVFK